jgi:hypothetical protein
MPLITVRVDEATKREMDSVPINWSEAIREAVHRVIAERRVRNRIRAAQLTDRIRMKAPPGFDSTRIIREWRDRRYGPRGRR